MSLCFFLRSSEKEKQKRRSNIPEQPAFTLLLTLTIKDETAANLQGLRTSHRLALHSYVFHFPVSDSPLGVLANVAALTASDSRRIDRAALMNLCST